MGLRENEMTIAEKLADVIERNHGGKNVKIEKRENETFIHFFHNSWNNCAMKDIFYYLGIKITDWLKNWSIAIYDEEVLSTSEEEYGREAWEYYPKKYRISPFFNMNECPHYLNEGCADCETCEKNIALRTIIEVQLFIKVETKECQHNFIYRSDWGNDLCDKCGWMQSHPKEKEGITNSN